MQTTEPDVQVQALALEYFIKLSLVPGMGDLEDPVYRQVYGQRDDQREY